MTVFAHPDVQDNGLNGIKNNATKQILVSSYTLGDSYATVLANAVATATMTPADFQLGTVGATRTLTTVAKSAQALVNSAPGGRHFVFTDGAAKVLWVTPESGTDSAAPGDTVNFPPVTYTNVQPILG